MIYEDYINRMSRQLADAVAESLKLKKERRYEEALGTIDLAFERLCGLKSRAVNLLSSDSLVGMLKLNTPKEAKKCFWLAELMKEEAGIFESREDESESTPRYLSSLELYLEGIKCKDRAVISNHESEIIKVIDKLKGHKLTEMNKFGLLKYSRRLKDYPKIKNSFSKLIK